MTLTTSVMLMLHHAFGVYNGDRRLRDKYGKRFEEMKARTSVVPFLAILEGIDNTFRAVKSLVIFFGTLDSAI